MVLDSRLDEIDVPVCEFMVFVEILVVSSVVSMIVFVIDRGSTCCTSEVVQRKAKAMINDANTKSATTPKKQN